MYQALCHPHPARLPPSLFLKAFPFPLEDISTYSTARISLPHTESRSLRNQRMYLSTENTLQAIQQLDTFTATQSNKDVGSFYRTQRGTLAQRTAHTLESATVTASSLVPSVMEQLSTRRILYPSLSHQPPPSR